MGINKVNCGGKFNKMLMTWEVVDEHTVKIETICRFCRGKSIVTINTEKGNAEYKYIPRHKRNFTSLNK